MPMGQRKVLDLYFVLHSPLEQDLLHDNITH